jgi:hypothetical protein
MQRRNHLLSSLLSSSLVAIGLSVAYLVFGSWRDPGTWAGILFYPGFVAGNWWFSHVILSCHLFDHTSASINILFCQVVGVGTMGVVGGIIGLVVHAAIRRRRTGRTGEETDGA